METRKISKLGVETSLLGFGGMRFPTTQNGKIDEKQSLKMIDAAYENGVNYFDTAYVYHDGQSEVFLGKALDRYPRHTYYLATKLPVWEVKEPQDVERLLDEQLSKLHKDYVDFYLLHALDEKRWEQMVEQGVPEICEKMKEKGKIKYFGFSFHDEYKAFEKILTARDWDFCQIQLNYMDIDIQAGLKGYRLAEERNIPMIIMEPVKGGSLAVLPDETEKMFKREEPNKSIASWALRWVASKPNIMTVLSGMSDMEQTIDNLETFINFEPMSEKENNIVMRAAASLRNRVANGCTGCGYCMPCPAGVDIPKNFHIWNQYHMYMNAGGLNWMWNNQIDDKEKADKCIKCGKCEQVCPQKLKIRENLETMSNEINDILNK